MANKITGVTKAAVAGALVGTAVGMASVPRAHHKKRKHRGGMAETAGNTLRAVGIAMENVADIIQR